MARLSKAELELIGSRKRMRRSRANSTLQKQARLLRSVFEHLPEPERSALLARFPDGEHAAVLGRIIVAELSSP